MELLVHGINVSVFATLITQGIINKSDTIRQYSRFGFTPKIKPASHLPLWFRVGNCVHRIDTVTVEITVIPPYLLGTTALSGIRLALCQWHSCSPKDWKIANSAVSECPSDQTRLLSQACYPKYTVAGRQGCVKITIFCLCTRPNQSRILPCTYTGAGFENAIQKSAEDIFALTFGIKCMGTRTYSNYAIYTVQWNIDTHEYVEFLRPRGILSRLKCHQGVEKVEENDIAV